MQFIKINYYKRTGKKFLPVLLFLWTFSSSFVFSQKHELGVGLGGFNYVGDINPRYNFLMYRPGAMGFYRYNFSNKYTAVRLSFSMGQLNGNEKRSNEVASINRNASFSTSLTEIALMGEYNFINYRDKKQLIKYSPYLTGGIALFLSDYSLKSNSKSEAQKAENTNFALPFGMGCKFMIGKYWNIAPEFVARKTFTDLLDGISNAEINLKNTGNPVDKDWYFYTGISISYTFYGVNCPQEYKF